MDIEKTTKKQRGVWIEDHKWDFLCMKAEEASNNPYGHKFTPSEVMRHAVDRYIEACLHEEKEKEGA